MPEADNHVLPLTTNDSWRTWLMTGVRRAPVDRRRMRGDHKGLKKMLIEGMTNGGDRPHAWKDFSGAMIRHAVDEAMRSLPVEEKRVVKLAYFGGYSNRDIARTVGLTEATVQRRLRRALSAISDYIQHGRALGRRAVFALLVWLSNRSLSDSTHHVVQAATVAAAATIVVVAQPNPVVTTPSQARHATPAAHAVPSIPSPTAAPPANPPSVPLKVPDAAIPVVKLPVTVPVTVPPIPTPLPLPFQPQLRA